MKKIIATALCLTLGAPCFAMGPQPPVQHGYNNAPYHQTMAPIEKPHHNHHHKMSPAAKTGVAVAGVVGLAMIVAAIVD